MRNRLAWLISLLGLLAACGESAPRYAPLACDRFVVPTTLGLAWQNLNHRISRWQVALEPPPGQACQADTLRATYVGGDWTTGETATDVPRVAWAGQRVQVDPAVLGVARVRVLLEIGAEGEVERQLTLTRADLHLLHYPRVVALIEGLALDTDVPQDAGYPEDYDPAHGYTSRGIGAWARVTAEGDEALAVTAGARFAHGTSDRPDMNGAIPFARTGATLDLLLLGVAEADVIEGQVDYTLTTQKPAFLNDEPCTEPTEQDADLALQGPAGAAPGLVGWTSFRFDLDPAEEEGAGYYIRELRVDLSPLAAPDAQGRLALRADGFACNASRFVAFYALRSRFQGAVAWIPVDVDTAPVVIEQAFDTGSAAYPLDGAIP